MGYYNKPIPPLLLSSSTWVQAVLLGRTLPVSTNEVVQPPEGANVLPETVVAPLAGSGHTSVMELGARQLFLNNQPTSYNLTIIFLGVVPG